jgi:hypothetical protein
VGPATPPQDRSGRGVLATTVISPIEASNCVGGVVEVDPPSGADRFSSVSFFRRPPQDSSGGRASSYCGHQAPIVYEQQHAATLQPVA